MSICNEKINPMKITLDPDNKENLKPYFNKNKNANLKLQIKVKLNPKMNQNLKILSKIDINCKNNCPKKRKNISQPKKTNDNFQTKNSQNNEIKHKKTKSCIDLLYPAEEKIINTTLSPKNINIFVSDRESDNLLFEEGQYFYNFNKILESTTFNIPENLLSRHEIKSNIRTKMVDWMIEVLSVFENMDETLFLAINIMDLYILKSKNILKNENIHLIGITSMFIASKFQEIYPITLKNFVSKVSHNQFNAEEIIKMEKIIFSEIEPESLVVTSIYDFIKFFIHEFYFENQMMLIYDKTYLKIFNYVKKTAIYLSKVLMHYEIFYKNNMSDKGICCIITAMKIVKTNVKEKWSSELNKMFNEWIILLIEKEKLTITDVEKLGSQIFSAFSHYQKSKSIARNLNRFTPLNFLKK